MNAGEPLNGIEAEEMMKEADKDGDGTIDYEGDTMFYHRMCCTVYKCYSIVYT